jgi:hypothetical protein
MRIKKSTPSLIGFFFSELGRMPLNIVRKERILKYWIKLLETDNCILKSLCNYILDDIDVHYNWLTNVQNLDLGYVWKNQYVENKSLFFANCNQLLKDSFIQEMHSFFERSPKCSMYRYLSDSFYLQYHLRKCLGQNKNVFLLSLAEKK